MLQESYINFHGTPLLVIVDQQGHRAVAIRPICEAIGVDVCGQSQKLRNDPKFSCRDMSSTGYDGKQYNMLCLPIEQLNGWLYGINSNKVGPASRQRLLTYQHECQEVLFRHFMPQGGTNEEVLGMLNALSERMDAGFAYIQTEMDDLRALVHVALSDSDEKEIRGLIHQVKEALQMDGRAIVGHVRATLGTSGIYEAPNLAQVKNVLRNMLGLGVLGVVPDP